MSLSLFNQISPRTAAAVYCTAVDMHSLPNIWAEQSVCTSLNKNAVTHSNLLTLKNVDEKIESFIHYIMFHSITTVYHRCDPILRLQMTELKNVSKEGGLKF